MNMKRIATLSFAALLLLLSTAASAVEPMPRWVQKGVKSLNGERTNNSYEFRAYTTSGSDINRLKEERLRPLLEDIGRRYGVRPENIRVAGLGFDDVEDSSLRIFLPLNGGVREVQAQLVDEYSLLEDNPDNSYAFDLHQLYAVSTPDADAEFDNFTVTRKYPAKAAFMSIIPGLGQIYKGQKSKGYAIMGAEAVFVAGTIYSAAEVARYSRLAKDNPDVADSYNSTVTTFRQLRNICLVAGGALYIYNLVDAAVCKGARRVAVKRRSAPDADLAFIPVVSQYGDAGVGLSITF